MKKFLCWQAYLTLFAVASTVSCDSVLGTRDSYVVRVDSIVSASAVAAGEELVIRFHGVVGSDQCASLTSADATLTPASLQLTFRGEWRRGLCGQMPVILDHTEVVAPPIQSPFTISVVQPDGPPLTKRVVVQ